jgi:hypothetical protein
VVDRHYVEISKEMEFRKKGLAAYIQGTAFGFIPLKIRYKKGKNGARISKGITNAKRC